MRVVATVLLTILMTAGCVEKEESVPAEAGARDAASAGQQTRTSTGISVPVGADPSPEELEQMRFDQRWRQLASFRRQSSGVSTTGATSGPNVRFVAPSQATSEQTLEGVTGETFDQLPLVAPIEGDMSGPSVLRAQALLDRVGFSPGIIDGRWGRNSEIALWWFQSSAGIQPTGILDQRSWQALLSRAGNVPTLVRHTLKEQDVEGPFVQIPDDVYEQAELDCLCYESLGEKLGELFHTTPELIASINGGVDPARLKAGDRIWVPAIGSTESRPISRITVSVQGNYLQGFDQSGSIVYHAPTTLGSEFDPSPSETLRIVGIANDPDFHYQPELFHEVPDDEPTAVLPAGPNSPVGVVWMALSKEHYGIHGTSNPSTIGYATSHGCVRLTNWDARNLSRRVQNGVEVAFEDTRGG